MPIQPTVKELQVANLESRLTGAANAVAISANGTLTLGNANLNFNNTATVNVAVTANGTGQANIGFTVNTTATGVVAAYAAANAAANTVRVSQNNLSTLDAKQLNFVNSPTVTISITDSGNGNANIAFTSAGGGGGSGIPALNVVTGTSVTAVKDNHYFLTNAALTIVTLPASPTSGDTVWITVGNSLLTNNVAGGGANIAGISDNLTINSSNVTLQMRYVNATYGWLVG